VSLEITIAIRKNVAAFVGIFPRFKRAHQIEILSDQLAQALLALATHHAHAKETSPDYEGTPANYVPVAAWKPLNDARITMDAAAGKCSPLDVRVDADGNIYPR
jgi:hypothetical protein